MLTFDTYPDAQQAIDEAITASGVATLDEYDMDAIYDAMIQRFTEEPDDEIRPAFAARYYLAVKPVATHDLYELIQVLEDDDSSGFWSVVEANALETK